MARSPRRFPCALALALAAIAAAGCITRTVRETVFDQSGIKVTLRSQSHLGTPVEEGYEHPFTISGVRLAHVLSRIDVSEESGKKRERRPAIPTESLYPIADLLSKALARADSTQVVVVQSVRRSKHLVVFDRYHLTSLLVWKKNDLLYVQVGRSSWEIPKRLQDQIPEPWAGEHPQEFRLLLDQGMTLVDAQTAAVEWRSPIFAKATRTRITPGGRVQRRNILMETLDEEPADQAPALPRDLTPAQLRALADLEEQRRAGQLSEAEYATERSRILSGAQGGGTSEAPGEAPEAPASGAGPAAEPAEPAEPGR